VNGDGDKGATLGPASLSATQAEELDRACDRFEAEWKAGKRPRIEDHLGGIDGPLRWVLLGELIAVELNQRRRLGENPAPAEFHVRFPAHVDAVSAAFGPAAARSRSRAAPLRPVDPAHGLLLALLAFQNHFIDREALLAALGGWVADKATPLGRILLDRGVLDAATHALLEALAKKHLEVHNGDAEKSLAALALGASTREVLGRVGDPDIQATLSQVGSALSPAEPDAESTASYVVGSATSEGQRFRVLRPHAKGGLGAVYVALDTELHREVALKQILESYADDQTSRSRFLLEAEITGGLEHPGIVPVYGLGAYADGRPYYAMRFIRGDSLKEAIEQFHADAALKADAGRRSLELRKLLRRFIDICNAIDYAHSRGVLHRDIKPGNIIVGKYGETLVVDWGLAKAMGRSDPGSDERTLRPSSGSSSAETLPGSALGTPAYMSPEQAEGDLERLGPRSDVYSLGATLYCLLTGRAPFTDGDINAVLRAVRQGELRPPRQVDPTVDRALEAVCLKAMAWRPEDRYDSCRELAEEIERWMADEPVTAWREPVSVRARRWLKRFRTAVAAAAATLVAGVVGLSAVAVVQSGANSALETKNLQLTAANAATTQREQEARDQAELANRRLYVSRMYLVQRYWEDYNGELFQQGLEEQLPEKQLGIDRRGWEWYYWHRKFSSGHTTLKGHTDPVARAAFSPDGTRVASAGSNGTLKLWDVATGQEIHALRGHTGSVRSVAFSPDGTHLVSACSDDMTVRIWDVATGREIRSLRENARNVVFNRDGSRLASASLDRTVRIWDAATGQEIGSLSGRTGVAFSPDGTRLASFEDDRTVRIWDVATGQEIGSLKGRIGLLPQLAFSPDGARLASAASDGTVKIFEVATGREIRSLTGHAGGVSSVAISPDGTRLASAGGTVKIWDVSTGQEIRSLKGHTGGVSSVAFSPDGTRVASAGGDQTVGIWNVAAGQENLALEGHTGHVSSVAFSPDGRGLASASLDRTVKLWDFATVQEIRSLKGHTGSVMSVAFSPDGRRLASASADGTAKLWDVATGQEIRSLKGRTGVAFSPDGTRLASIGDDQTVKLWDVATGQEIGSLRGHTGFVNYLAFSPDGTLLASASFDQTVKLWDVATRQEIRSLKGHTGAVKSVAFAPDGTRLATASHDTVKIWDVARGKETRSLKGHGSVISSVAFSPDGMRLASSSWDGTVKIWDMATGQEVLSLKKRSGGEASLAFSPDGRRLAAAAASVVEIWDATPMTPESRARDDALRLIRFLLARVTSESDLHDRIARDPTISKETRATALKLASGFWSMRIRWQANRLISSLFARLLLRADVLDGVRADRTLNTELRTAALALAETWTEAPRGLNDAAWELVKLPNRPDSDFRRGLRLAETACQLTRQNGFFLNTLGVAQYRVGQFEKALATLSRSNQLNGNREPGDLAFLAMAQQRLGQSKAARATLIRLREFMKTAEVSTNRENWAFLREAAGLILGPPAELPEEVFAR
jgi:WD40 repeat protein/tRNA A-37 threonylcarbamoyl transferase component Bud32